ncbi:MAG: UDP-2,3-diacylglucosamine diphosphatase LpxI [Desulfosudaceae bacterium]
MNIGLIAGGGRFPLLFADAAKAKGYTVYAVAYRNAADPDIANRVQQVEWLHLGEIERLIAFFRDHQVTETVVMGAIEKTVMFTDIKPDQKALAMISRMTETHDDQLLRCFAEELEAHKLQVRASTFILPELLAAEGVWTTGRPDEERNRDIAIGWKVAKAIGKLDVGQCVVVEKGSVLAVEGIDGTDATILRGGSLGGGNAVVVKVCKPQQDLRFDIPSVGARTIDSMSQAGARTLAVEAGKTVVFDKREMIELAEKAGISIVARKEE